MTFIPEAAPLPSRVAAGLLFSCAFFSVFAMAVGQAQAADSTDPADPKARVPAALYLSPLRAYQGFAETKVAPWRETNAAMGQRGAGGMTGMAGMSGMSGMAGMQMPMSETPSAAASVPAKGAKLAVPGHADHADHAGHAGHGMK